MIEKQHISVVQPRKSIGLNPMKRSLLLLLSLILAACSTAVQVPDKVEATAFQIVDDVLAQTLDSQQAPGASYQHSDLSVLRFASKSLPPDAIAANVTSLWCVNVGYRISSAGNDDPKNWREAEFIILVVEQDGLGFAGGEWATQASRFSYGSVENYNAAAWQDCLAR